MIAIGVFDGDELFTISRKFDENASNEEMLKEILKAANYEDPTYMAEFLIIPGGTGCGQLDPSALFKE